MSSSIEVFLFNCSTAIVFKLCPLVHWALFQVVGIAILLIVNSTVYRICNEPVQTACTSRQYRTFSSAVLQAAIIRHVIHTMSYSSVQCWIAATTV